ncbi:U3 snoRNP protein [Coemansia sp. Benny D115]|nr:U3 snoRNP protein [Coemansia sp. Benny D115]
MPKRANTKVAATQEQPDTFTDKVSGKHGYEETQKVTDRKRQKKLPPSKKTKAETDLENVIFGGDEEHLAERVFGNMDDSSSEDMNSGSENESDEEVSDKNIDEDSEDEDVQQGDDSLFFVDTKVDSKVQEESDNEDTAEVSNPTSEDESAAWVDEDTQNVTVALADKSRTRKLRTAHEEDSVTGDVYEKRLRQQFQKINPVPKWAVEATTEGTKKSDTVGADLLSTTAPLVSKSSTLLPSSKLDIVKLLDANHKAPSQSAVSSVQFHPTSTVMMTAGMDKTLRLFDVDGKENQKIQSIYFKDLPITTAKFINQGKEIVATGRRGWYYSVDVAKGSVTRIRGIPGLDMHNLEFLNASTTCDKMAVRSNNGQIHLISTSTKQLMNTLSMNGVVRDISFTADGNYLWSTGLDNEVYQWDLRQNKCISRWHDSTTFKPTCLDISPDSTYYASGDKSGIVNIYNTATMKKKQMGSSGAFYEVEPFKVINNLTTSIRDVKFNHNSELLAFYSRAKTNQFRMVHLPSATVFSNWPTQQTGLNHVQCVDFSPHSGFIAIGNDVGRAMLFRLQHYQDY